MKTWTHISWALCLALATVILFPPGLPDGGPKPLILVYCDRQPGYGRELARLLVDDRRIDAEMVLLETEELFEAMIYHPYVKVIVVSLCRDESRGFGDSINRFFEEGGGIVGLGFVGSWRSSGNASKLAFPLWGNENKAGAYDPKKKLFTHRFIKEEAHQVTEGVGDFTSVAPPLLVLSYNLTAETYWPRRPEHGDWRVLFRDSLYGAPAIVAYEANGTSVTFATFGGDDFERSHSYYGHFASLDEFRTLFTNAVYWVWTQENRYESSLARSTSFFDHARQRSQEIRDKAQEASERRDMANTLRIALTFLLAAAASLGVYWAGFLKHR